jgi:predicted nucleotide-binding protein
MKTNVYIVPGGDSEANESVVRLIESFKLTPTIINTDRIIIDEEQYNDASYAIIIYSPDEEGYEKTYKIPQPRARQNVVFKHGYLIGRMGRPNVCALLTDRKIEMPDGILGILYMIKQNEWQVRIAEKLRIAGFDIDRKFIR